MKKNICIYVCIYCHVDGGQPTRRSPASLEVARYALASGEDLLPPATNVCRQSLINELSVAPRDVFSINRTISNSPALTHGRA